MTKSNDKTHQTNGRQLSYSSLDTGFSNVENDWTWFYSVKPLTFTKFLSNSSFLHMFAMCVLFTHFCAFSLFNDTQSHRPLSLCSSRIMDTHPLIGEYTIKSMRVCFPYFSTHKQNMFFLDVFRFEAYYYCQISTLWVMWRFYNNCKQTNKQNET